MYCGIWSLFFDYLCLEKSTRSKAHLKVELLSVIRPHEIQNRPKRGASFRSIFRHECPARRIAPKRSGLVDVPPTGIHCAHQYLRPSLRVLLRAEAKGVAAY